MTGTTDALMGKTTECQTNQKYMMDRQCTKSHRTQWKQWLACISATLSMVMVGTVFGWTTTILSRLLTSKDVPINVTNDESSWIVSLTVIGSMIGPFLGAWHADRFGRKKCLLLSSLFFIVGWLIIILATNVWSLYVSRMILGVGVGMSYTTNPMYVSEVADVNIRGALGTLITVNVFTGSLLTCSIGPWVSYQLLGIILLTIPVIFISTFIWFPETPVFLAGKGRLEEATQSIAFFKGIEDKEEARKELDIVLRNVGEDDTTDGPEIQRWKDRMCQLLLPTNRRALCIVIGLVITQQLSGAFSTMQYLETLFKGANISIDSNIASIIVIGVGLVSGTVATMTVEGAGRRPLLIMSTLGSSITLVILAVYLVFNARGDDISVISFLPVVDVIIFQISYQIGLGTLPNALIGELFPTNVKGVAGATVTVTDGLLGFTVSKLYQVIDNSLGSFAVYFFFAGFCFLGFIFVILFVPETKGKTLTEIQEILQEPGFRCRTNKRSQDDVNL